MTEERIQEIYDNGAELTTDELAEYTEATIKSNIDPNFQFLGAEKQVWMRQAEKSPEHFIEYLGGAFDWKLEYRGENNWYLHPWGK